MSITIGRLHKELGKLIENGKKRQRVCISKTTFTHNLEDDGCTILDVEKAELRLITMADGDGYQAMRKDGSESRHVVLVLSGNGEE
jgi:hypothetical protein